MILSIILYCSVVVCYYTILFNIYNLDVLWYVPVHLERAADAGTCGQTFWRELNKPYLLLNQMIN